MDGKSYGKSYGKKQSVLSIIEQIDKFPYEPTTQYYTLVAHDGATEIGYVTEEIAQHFAKEHAVRVDGAARTVTIDGALDTIDKRNAAFADIAHRFRRIDEFDHCLNQGWRNELYTVYNPSQTPYMRVERAFSILMGVVTYGIHLTGYVPANRSANGKLKIWVPRRSASKQTYPGMLDNTVAGGLGYPHGPWETVVKESYEEAGLPADFVEQRAKCTGVASYIYLQGETGSIAQPEVEYLYDLAFDDETSVVPHPVDGEAQDFILMDVDEVLRRIENDEFKPNCALVTIDFLIRHGHITPESEPNFLQIVSRIHRRIPFPTM